MIRALLFDVDGVLYDSMPLHTRSWQTAFRDEGISIPRNLVYLAEGMPDKKAAGYMLEQVKTTVSVEVTERIVANKIRLFNTYPKPRFIAGARPFLLRVRKAGVKICLVTGSAQEATIRRLGKDFGIPRHSIISGLEVKHGKPHPEPYLLALKRVREKTRNVIVIENAPLGVQSAKRAGLRCLAINTGPISPTQLKSSGADTVVSNYRDLNKEFTLRSGS